MSAGAVTDNIDVAQLTLYAFWIFFAGLIIYLRREDKREGYPLEQQDASPHTLIDGFPGRPDPKTFLLPHGGTRTVPQAWTPEPAAEMRGTPVAAWPGAPMQPNGNPMLAGVGPGAWANRPDEPDLTLEGLTKIVPLRADGTYSVDPRDPDPRGMKVIGADGAVGGVVGDIWVDRSERLFRYYELTLADGSRSVLVPVNFCMVSHRAVKVDAILGSQFADVPALSRPDQVSLLEEDKICAYYGGGTLYATASRLGPLL